MSTENSGMSSPASLTQPLGAASALPVTSTASAKPADSEFSHALSQQLQGLYQPLTATLQNTESAAKCDALAKLSEQISTAEFGRINAQTAEIPLPPTGNKTTSDGNLLPESHAITVPAQPDPSTDAQLLEWIAQLVPPPVVQQALPAPDRSNTENTVGVAGLTQKAARFLTTSIPTLSGKETPAFFSAEVTLASNASPEMQDEPLEAIPEALRPVGSAVVAKSIPNESVIGDEAVAAADQLLHSHETSGAASGAAELASPSALALAPSGESASNPVEATEMKVETRMVPLQSDVTLLEGKKPAVSVSPRSENGLDIRIDVALREDKSAPLVSSDAGLVMEKERETNTPDMTIRLADNSPNQKDAEAPISQEHGENAPPFGIGPLAATGSQGPMSQASRTEGLPSTLERLHTDPAWRQELGDRILWMVNRDQQAAELKLNPANLGPLEVRITLSQDQASLQFYSHHAAVREAVESALPKLREMLGAQQLNLHDVSVAQYPSGEQHDPRNSQSASGQQAGFERQGSAYTDQFAAEPSADLGPSVAAVRVNQGLVNLYA